MADHLNEQSIPQEEIMEAKRMMTEEQKVMSEARANILGPLDLVELSEQDRDTICRYADLAGEAARREFLRLQRESPVNLLIDVLNKMRSAAPNELYERMYRSNLYWVNLQLKNWQRAVTIAQGAAEITGQHKTLGEIIPELFEVYKDEEINRVPTNWQRGINPCIFITTDINNPEKLGTERILRNLGFLPKNVPLESIFSLPVNPSNGLGENPTRVREDLVVGLNSPLMPGVLAEVQARLFTFDNAYVNLRFKPEAIVRSVTKIPASATT